MGISIEEQEICVQASRDQQFARAYVTDRTYMTKLDRMVERAPDKYRVVEEHKIQGEVIGKTYEFPKKLLSFRSGSDANRVMTDKQREEARQRMIKWQEEQRKKKLNQE